MRTLTASRAIEQQLLQSRGGTDVTEHAIARPCPRRGCSGTLFFDDATVEWPSEWRCLQCGREPYRRATLTIPRQADGRRRREGWHNRRAAA